MKFIENLKEYDKYEDDSKFAKEYDKFVVDSFTLSDRELYLLTETEIHRKARNFWSDTHCDMTDNTRFRNFFSDKEEELYKKKEEITKQQEALKDDPNTYVRGGMRYKYKENSRAKDMRKCREKKARPKNISPDMSKYLYDIEYERDKNGKKVRHGEVYKVYSQEKADKLIGKLSYQTDIKWTTFIYFLKSGDKISTDKIEVISKHILDDEIDMTKGIYANQRYHLDISRRNVRFKALSELGCYFNARDHIKKDDSSIVIAKSKVNKKKIVIKGLSHLRKIRDEINWDEKVLWFTTKPYKRDSSSWNEEMGGYWLNIGKISDTDKINRYEKRLCLDAPVKNCLMPKTLIDRALFRHDEKEVKRLLECFKVFDYSRCNWLLETGQIFRDIAKYYGRHLKELEFKYDQLVFQMSSHGGYERAFSNYCQDFAMKLMFKISEFLKINFSENSRIKEIADKYLNKHKDDYNMTFYKNIEEVTSKAEEVYKIKSYNKTLDEWTPLDRFKPLGTTQYENYLMNLG